MRAENHIFSQSNNTPSKYSLKSPNNNMMLSAGPTYRGNTPNKTQRIRTIDHNNMMYNTQTNFGGQGARTRVDFNNTTVASSGGR
jgi:hypothetical protein